MNVSIRYASLVAAVTVSLLTGCGGGGGGGSTGTGTSSATTATSSTPASTTVASTTTSSTTTPTTPATPTATPSSTPATTTTTTTTASVPTVFSKFTSNVKVSQDGNYLVVETDDLPNHRSVYWPTTNSLYEPDTDPNFSRAPNSTIQTQTVTFRLPLNPSEATVKQATRLGPIGVSLNGVVFFNQYNGAGQPLTTEILSFDQYNGHPNPQNMYHYHVEPTYLTQSFGKDALIGFLADGFPVYGPVENGKTITNADLDQYHGHKTATSDYPNGIYHYHITAEDPYINGGSYFGTPGTISQ